MCCLCDHERKTSVNTSDWPLNNDSPSAIFPCNLGISLSLIQDHFPSLDLVDLEAQCCIVTRAALQWEGVTLVKRAEFQREWVAIVKRAELQWERMSVIAVLQLYGPWQDKLILLLDGLAGSLAGICSCSSITGFNQWESHCLISGFRTQSMISVSALVQCADRDRRSATACNDCGTAQDVRMDED